MDRATQDRLERRLAKLEQDARSGRPVNVTTPRQDAIYLPRFEDALGVSPTGFPILYPDYALGYALAPQIGNAVPFVPQTSGEIFAKSFEYGLINITSIYVWKFFCIDATQTGNTIEGFFVYRAQAGTKKRMSLGLLTKSPEPLTKGTTEYYWKGGVQRTNQTTWPPGRPHQTITTDNASYPITGIDAAFIISGNLAQKFPTGRTFTVAGSTDNDGQYTVSSATYNTATNTTALATTPAIPSTTPDGTITIGGTLLIYNPTTKIHDLIDLSGFPVHYHLGKQQWTYIPDNELTYDPHLQRPYVAQFNSIPYLLLEHIPGKYIPKGCYTLEAAGQGRYAIRLRYRHHTTGDIYEGIIDLPNLRNAGAQTYAPQVDLIGDDLEAVFGSFDGPYNPHHRTTELPSITLPD
jgi:hypothetical protein